MATESFYNNASLAYLASAGAGKDGKAYSVKPVPQYGTELVTNGGFDTDSDWGKVSATISGGTGNLNGTGVTSLIFQSGVLTQNITYRLTFSVSNYNSLGQLEVINNDGTSYYLATNNGNHTVEFTHSIPNQNFLFRAKNNAIAEIDNVSVRKVIVGDGDFTFSRGSNLAATRVGPTGLIEKGRENLLLQSNNFDTTWSTSASSVTGGQSGYDGSSDAWLFSANGAYQRMTQPVSSSGVQTYSVYAKANTTDFLLLRCNIGGNQYAIFNLSDGTIPTLYAGFISGNATSVGNGWYRVSLLFNGSLSEVAIGASTDGTIAGWDDTTNESIYIQDAQLEIGLAATDYIETGATTGKAGILENEPRFDYSGGATCPSLLLEPSRTNLVPYSEYIEGLGLTDLTATPNATTSPEGLQNAYKMLTGTAGSEQIAYQALGTSGNTKTQSVYIKADSGVQWIRLIQIRLGFGNSASTHFDIQNGVKGAKEENGTTSVVDDATKIEDAGNGWYRLTLVCTDSTNNTTFDTRVRTAIADGSATRVSNGSYFVWGYQMESDASYPTSYIPNHSGGSVTRGVDFCLSAGDTSTFNDSEGVIFLEAEGLVNGGENRYITLGDNTSSNRLQIVYSFTINRLQISGTSALNGNFTAINYNSFNQTDLNKVAVKYSATELTLFVNGVKIESNNSNVSFANGTLDSFDFTLWDKISAPFQAKLNQALYFPTALSDVDSTILTGATAYDSFSAMAEELNYTIYE